MFRGIAREQATTLRDVLLCRRMDKRLKTVYEHLSRAEDRELFELAATDDGFSFAAPGLKQLIGARGTVGSELNEVDNRWEAHGHDGVESATTASAGAADEDETNTNRLFTLNDFITSLPGWSHTPAHTHARVCTHTEPPNLIAS